MPPRKVEDEIVAAEETAVEKEKVVITISPPDLEWRFDILFDKFIRLPANCTEWTDSNEGAQMIKIEYKPSVDTETLMYD